MRSGLDGVSYALSNLAPLHLMCDRSDLGVTVARGSGTGSDDAVSGDALSTVFIYEQIAAGLGFSMRLFEQHADLIAAASNLVRRCSCPHGCPACVGPVLENELAFLETKRLAQAILDQLSGRQHGLSVDKQRSSGGLADDVSF